MAEQAGISRDWSAANAQLSRRRLLQLGAVGTALTVAGCRAAKDQPTGSTTRHLTIAQTGVIDGQFRVNQATPDTSWRRLAYNRLTAYDHATLKPRPELATAWKTSKDGREVTLSLRDDVKWHSGRPFEASDVVFTLQKMDDPRFSFQWMTKLMDADAPDKTTVRFRLKQPLSNLFDLFELMAILDKESIAEFEKGTRFVGTGPFKVKALNPNDSMELVKNTGYWRPGQPKLDGVTIRMLTDEQAAVASIRTNQSQLALNLVPRDVIAVAKEPGVSLTKYSTYGEGLYIGANVKVSPLDRKEVRQAINYAVDRNRIVREVLQNIGFPSSAPWGKTSPAYSAESADRYTHDPAKAKRLLAEAGASGAHIVLQYPLSTAIAAAAAPIIEFSLKQVGLEVESRGIGAADAEQRFAKRNYDGLWLSVAGYNTLNPVDPIYTSVPYKPAPDNLFNFSDPRYGRLAAAALSARTHQAQKTAYDAVTRYLLDQAFCVDYALTTATALTRGLRNWGYTLFDELVLDEATLD